MRTSTLAYDIIGLLSYMYQHDMFLNDVYDLLNNYNIKFDGIDGGFYFKDNVIERYLDIVQIFLLTKLLVYQVQNGSQSHMILVYVISIM